MNEVSADAKNHDGQYLVANAASMYDATKASVYSLSEEAIDLDEMVCQSIAAVDNPELRKRLAS